jgi:hypothetical protein
MTRVSIIWFAVVASMLLVGCAPNTQQVMQLALNSEFKEFQTNAPLPILALLRQGEGSGGNLRIYIEGDGRAWADRTHVSLDPTPRDPVALGMALADRSGSVAYLGRPCQYVLQKVCHHDLWTDGRFSEDIVKAMGMAVDSLKARAGAEKIELIGYSGGAAIAALLAARRRDVIWFATVAGNLAHEEWTRMHNISPLGGSLSVVERTAALASIRQVHFVGGRDDIVPESLLAVYLAGFQDQTAIKVIAIPGYDHGCCWQQNWPDHLEHLRRWTDID